MKTPLSTGETQRLALEALLTSALAANSCAVLLQANSTTFIHQNGTIVYVQPPEVQDFLLPMVRTILVNGTFEGYINNLGVALKILPPDDDTKNGIVFTVRACKPRR